MELIAPPGFCQCGCGEQTRIDPKTKQPREYVRGHNRRAITLSDGRRICRKCGEAKPLEEFTKRSSERFVDGRDPWCKKCYAAKQRYYYQRSREQYATASYRRKIKNKYGISWDQFEQRLKEQGGGCAICDSTDNLVVDHCHDSGRARGIICKPCNTGIGQLGDNAERVLRAAKYLAGTTRTR